MSDAPTVPVDDPIERAQMAALVKRLQAGTPLTDAHLRELRAYQEREAAKKNPPPPTPTKRGRRPKAVIPKITAESSAREAQTALVLEAKQRMAAGRTLPNHLARALRDAWLLEDSVHIWPNLAAAAADCKVSVTTFRSFADQGCPIEPHSPIAKAPVLAWLLDNAHQRGGDRGATTDTLEALEVQWRQAKLAKLNDHLIAEAEDRAHQGVLRTMGGVRHHLKHSLPGALFDVVAAAQGDRTAAETAIADLIENELRRLEPPAPKKPEAPQ